MNNNVFSSYKLKIYIIFLSCISFSESYNLREFSSYNSSLNRDKRQVKSFTGCTLLNHPPNGRRRAVFSKTPYIPNTLVSQNTIITVECNEGYKIINFDNNKSPDALCFNGEWLGNIEADVCRRINSASVIDKNQITTALEPYYYWRIYNGTIPTDAVSTEVENLFVARVGVCINDDHTISYYAGTVNSTTKTATIAAYDKKMVIYNKNTIMILCTSEPERLKWENVTTQDLKGSFVNKLVPASLDEGYERYVGKVFHENVWKISSVYRYGHEYAGFQLWNDRKDLETIISNFQVLVQNY